MTVGTFPWGDHIPGGWGAKRLRFISTLGPSKKAARALSPETLVSFVPMEAIGEWGGLRLDEDRQLEEVGAGHTYFAEGDVVVAKVTPCFENGKGALAAGLTGGIAFGSTELHVLRSGPLLDRKFLFYLTETHPFRSIGTSEMYGAGGQKRVPEWFFRDYVAPLPPLRVQRTIAEFLERKTAAVDALITRREQLLALLAEKRKAVVRSTVSRGLDASVPFRDSGVPWLGEVPAHWTVMPLKHAALDVIDCKNRTPDYVEDGQFAVVRTPNVRLGRFVEDDLLLTDEKNYREWTQRGSPRAGDVMFTREAPAGEACVVPRGMPVCLGQRMMLIRIGRNLVDSDFVLYSMYGPQVQEFITAAARGSTVSHLRVDEVRNLQVPVPPVKEQRAIGAYLRCATEAIDALAEVATRQLALLREHRQALITGAITGQLDVTGPPQEAA